MIELLAPAGDLEKLKFALHYGADAVYIGGQNYSLRANAKNFSLRDIEEGVSYAHQYHKKVYVTVNIVFHNDDVKGLEDYLKELARIKVDGIIVSDVYVISLVKKNHIPIEVHLSTQASVLNSYAAKFYKDLGVKRIVLAREASEYDIATIKKNTGLDLECFVHGAMCTSISGRCVLSNVCTNRDANRGGCAQICRWTFDIPNQPTFTMTSKDLNMIPYIKEMMNIGVNSFKVEGRMRGIYYIATVILCYRRMIDLLMKDELTNKEANYYLKVLNRCANRDSDPQFFKGIPDEKEQYFFGRSEVSNQDFLGLVKEMDINGQMVTIEQRNVFHVGDEVEFFGPNLKTFSYTIQEIWDEDGHLIDVANHPDMLVKIKMPYPLEVNGMMRVKLFDKDALL